MFWGILQRSDNREEDGSLWGMWRMSTLAIVSS